MNYYRICGCTAKGPVREANEDHILLGRFIENRGRLSLVMGRDDDFLSHYGLVLAVADGIGGVAAGALASRLALTALERQFYAVEKFGQDLEVVAEVLQSAAVRANETLLAMGAKRPEVAGLGCTLTGVCLTANGYLVFNAGDSRVYHFRSGILAPLTTDDTVTAMAVSLGQLTAEAAKTSPSRHTLSNSLGTTTFTLGITLGTKLPQLVNQDLLLICSDGLYDLVGDQEMEEILSSSLSEEELVDTLMARAERQGGHDNISVILIRAADVEESPLPENEPVPEPPAGIPGKDNE